MVSFENESFADSNQCLFFVSLQRDVNRFHKENCEQRCIIIYHNIVIIITVYEYYMNIGYKY